MYEKVIFLFLLINIPIIIFYNKIAKKIDIHDIADGIRKFRRGKIPLLGGSWIIYNIIFFSIIDYFINLNSEYIFSSTREYFSFFTGIVLLFLIGLYDDKYDLSPNKKLFLNSLVILFILLIDNSLVIKELTFSFLEHPIKLKNVSYFFSLLCFLLFLNALNMFDGINLQASSFSLFVFLIFLHKDLYTFYSLIIIFTLLVFIYYNYLNKIFLGDSGTQSLAFVISYFLITSYNQSKSISPEEIFVILSYPGLDMFRLFLFRIAKGKHPFKGDTNHIHHLIENRFNSIIAFFIIFILIIINIFFYYLITNKMYSILFTVSSYTILFILFKKYERVNF